MQFSKLVDNRLVAVLAGATAVALIGAGAGYSAGLITSADIKDKTIKVKDLKPGTVKKLKGQTGPAGPAGPAGPSGSGETVVSVLGSTQPWDATNASVSLTPDGVEYGPYAAGGATGGSVCSNNLLKNQPFTAVRSLSYYMRYMADDNTSGVGSPYLRVYFNSTDSNGDQNRAIFSPNTQAPDGYFPEGPLVEYVATQGSWRWQDDGGSNPGAEAPFATIVAAHAAETIDTICISDGFSAGTNLKALLRWVEVNGKTYVFRGN